MADVTLIIVHRVLIVRPRYLLYFTTACFLPCSKFDAIFKYGLMV